MYLLNAPAFSLSASLSSALFLVSLVMMCIDTHVLCLLLGSTIIRTCVVITHGKGAPAGVLLEPSPFFCGLLCMLHLWISVQVVTCQTCSGGCYCGSSCRHLDSSGHAMLCEALQEAAKVRRCCVSLRAKPFLEPFWRPLRLLVSFPRALRQLQMLLAMCCCSPSQHARSRCHMAGAVCVWGGGGRASGAQIFTLRGYQHCVVVLGLLGV